MEDRGNGSDSESDTAVELDWESLRGHLSAGGLEALQQHMQDRPGGQHPPVVNMSPTSVSGNDAKDSVNQAPTSSALPDSNKAYKLKEYWDDRFETEERYDWLANYDDVAEHVREIIPKDARVLVVGCGNSGLSTDMYDDGYRDLLSTDFSQVVVEKMRARSATSRPGLRWAQMDMLGLDMGDGSVDAVVDKAAMDALMVDKGDPWNPSPTAVEQTHRMCSEISRVLVPGGVYVQLSFEQPHFRRKLLLGEHIISEHRSVGTEVTLSLSDERLCQDNSRSDVERNAGASAEQCVGAAESGGRWLYGWDVEVREIQQEGGCFGNFLYVMRNSSVLL